MIVSSNYQNNINLKRPSTVFPNFTVDSPVKLNNKTRSEDTDRQDTHEDLKTSPAQLKRNGKGINRERDPLQDS